MNDEKDTQHTLREIAKLWNRRVEGQGMKRGSARYAKAQLEFLMGAHAGLIAAGRAGLPEMLLVCVSVGRDINEFVKDAA